jgi:hypothetical protein
MENAIRNRAKVARDMLPKIAFDQDVTLMHALKGNPGRMIQFSTSKNTVNGWHANGSSLVRLFFSSPASGMIFHSTSPNKVRPEADPMPFNVPEARRGNCPKFPFFIPATVLWPRPTVELPPKGTDSTFHNSTFHNSSLHNSSLHILFVSSPDSNSFSELMLHFFLKNYDFNWGFNHVRLINLCNAPLLPPVKPKMETATSSLLIIHHLDDLTGRAQTVLRTYCSHLNHRKAPFLLLLHVPRMRRCQPGLMHRAKRRRAEKVHTDFLMTFFSPDVKKTVIFRALACTRCDSRRLVKKVIKWIKLHNVPIPMEAEEVSQKAFRLRVLCYVFYQEEKPCLTAEASV